MLTFTVGLLALVGGAFADASRAEPRYVKLCTQPEFQGTCLDIPIHYPSCVNFIGGLTILNKEVSSVQVPQDTVCNLFEAYGCSTVSVSSGTDTIVVSAGDWPSLAEASGIRGRQNFDNTASSMLCTRFDKM